MCSRKVTEFLPSTNFHGAFSIALSALSDPRREPVPRGLWGLAVAPGKPGGSAERQQGWQAPRPQPERTRMLSSTLGLAWVWRQWPAQRVCRAQTAPRPSQKALGVGLDQSRKKKLLQAPAASKGAGLGLRTHTFTLQLHPWEGNALRALARSGVNRSCKC